MFLNTSPFDCFPFVFVFPVVFPASSSMFFVFSGHPVALRLSFGHVAPRDEQTRASRAVAHHVRLLTVEQGRRRPTGPCRNRPPPVPCSSASRRWLLLGRVPCRPQPPHSVLPAGPASAALCSRPGLVKLSTSSGQGCSRSPLRSHHVLLPMKKMT